MICVFIHMPDFGVSIYRLFVTIYRQVFLFIDLAEENRLLREQKTCKICLDAEVGVVFLPCGHLCCCVLCAPAVRQCPICRAEIRGTVRTFIP